MMVVRENAVSQACREREGEGGRESMFRESNVSNVSKYYSIY